MEFAKHVRTREERFGSVIFETLREKVYVTNGTGSDILRLIKEGKDKDSIVRDLCGLYRADTVRIGEEVAAFIEQLKEKGLIAE